MDSPALVANVLVNVTNETGNIQSEDVTIVSSLLDRVANSTDVEEDMQVRMGRLFTWVLLANLR